MIQDIDSLAHLQENTRKVEVIDRAEAVEGIRRGLSSMERGEGRPVEEVFEDIRRRHHIPRDA